MLNLLVLWGFLYIYCFRTLLMLLSLLNSLVVPGPAWFYNVILL